MNSITAIKDLIAQSKSKLRTHQQIQDVFYYQMYTSLIQQLSYLGYDTVEIDTPNYGYERGPYIVVSRLTLDKEDNKLTFYKDRNHSSPIGKLKGSFQELPLQADKSMVVHCLLRFIESYYKKGTEEIEKAVAALESI